MFKADWRENQVRSPSKAKRKPSMLNKFRKVNKLFWITLTLFGVLIVALAIAFPGNFVAAFLYAILEAL